MQLAFLGFGEAARAFMQGWTVPLAASAFDIKTDHEATRDQKLADYTIAAVSGHLRLADALTGANAIFSLVTADQASVAAEAAYCCIQPGQFYFDCNSCSPDTKRSNAAIIAAAGGRYVDVAVMAPVYPGLHKTPLLICGEHATEAATLFAALEMNATVIEGGVGKASAIKMIRSVMIKGLEALNAECLLAARKAGVETEVLASLDQSFPSFDWSNRSAYMLERMMVHGVRRAAEMREVAATVEQLDLNNAMASATVTWQQAIGEMHLPASADDGVAALADRVLARLHDC